MIVNDREESNEITLDRKKFLAFLTKVRMVTDQLTHEAMGLHGVNLNEDEIVLMKGYIKNSDGSYSSELGNSSEEEFTKSSIKYYWNLK